MRRYITRSLVFSLISLCGAAAMAQDGLFSDISINSVFSKPGAGQMLPGGQPIGPPISQPPPSAPPTTGASALAAAMKEAGFEPKQLSEQVVQTKVQLDRWSFPVLVTSDPKKQEVIVVLLLSVVKDEKQLPASKLLELLDASREHSPAYFAYSSKRKRIELYRTLDDVSPSSETLKTEINRLAQIAKGTETLWNLVTTTVQKPVTPPAANAAPGPATQAPVTQTPSMSLAGKWSAARSEKEAFALLLTAAGKYTLVHVRQGKQTKSTGTYSLAGGRLTLAGSDGTKIAGTVSAPTQQQFVFTPQASNAKAAPLTFKRAT